MSYTSMINAGGRAMENMSEEEANAQAGIACGVAFSAFAFTVLAPAAAAVATWKVGKGVWRLFSAASRDSEKAVEGLAGVGQGVHSVVKEIL